MEPEEAEVVDKHGVPWSALELLASLRNMASAFSVSGSDEDREAAVESFENSFEYLDWVEE